jgi:hypothetical protein
MNDRPFRLRFELPREELQRAQEDARRAAVRPSGGRPFEEDHLRGRLHLDVGVPLAEDPVLEFLRDRRGLRTTPPFTISLDQPLAFVIGALSSRAVMALHGEGSFMVPLAGDRGALGVALDGGNLDISLPLQQYAGVACVPAAVAARAVAAAASDLARLVSHGAPSLADWAVVRCLEREAQILRAIAQRNPWVSGPTPEPKRSQAFALAERWSGLSPGLVETLEGAERAGAHVIPYWRVEGGDGRAEVRFVPLGRAPLPHARGSLARLLFPDGEATLDAVWTANGDDTTRLRKRLARPAPFRARSEASTGRLRLQEEAAPPPTT